MITNRREDHCASCSAKVAVGAGYAYSSNQSNGRPLWRCVCASRACHEALGIAESRTREMRADGTVHMPRDNAALPLLRSLPGARWDPNAKAWRFSLAPKDRARVLEIGRELALDIAPELSVYAVPESVTEADRRAMHPGLYPFQRAGVRFLALRNRALLADDMGLGKTVQALIALPEGQCAIVVCPSSVKLNWRDEIQKWRPDLTPVVVKKKKDFRAPILIGEVVIVNEECLPGIAELAEHGLSEATLIYDEAHRAKNYKTQRAKKIALLARKCARAWLLTGTPLLNDPPDLFGVLEAGGLAGEVFGGFKNFQRLFQAYAVRHGRGAYDVHTEYGAPLPEVPERLKRAMLRRVKSEVLSDLPAKVYSTVPVECSRSEIAEMDDLWEEYGEFVQTTNELPVFSEFSALRAALAASRVDAMTEIVEAHEAQRTPLVVFSAHRAPIDALEAREGWRTITGDTTAEGRRDAVRAFQAGELHGLALTIQAGGVGLTLTRASRVLFVDLDWTPALNAQAEDRVCRIGQTAERIEIMRLVSDHKLDRHILKLLDEKIALIGKAIDGVVEYAVPARVVVVDETEAEMLRRKGEIEAAWFAAQSTEKAERLRNHISSFGHWCPESALPAATLLDDAFEFLAGRCDGAVQQDGAGFNKADARVGQWIYAMPASVDRLRALWSLLRKYDKQLRRGGIILEVAR